MSRQVQTIPAGEISSGDVLVIAISHGELSEGITAAKHLRGNKVTCPIIILTEIETEDALLQLI